MYLQLVLILCLLYSKFSSLSSITSAGPGGLPGSVTRAFILEEYGNHTIGNHALLRLELLCVVTQRGKVVPRDAQLHHKDSTHTCFPPSLYRVKAALPSLDDQGQLPLPIW